MIEDIFKFPEKNIGYSVTPVREMMKNPEALEKMVLEDGENVSVIINKNFMKNDEVPIVISGNGNKYMLSKKIISQEQKVIREKDENGPGAAEVYEEVEYSNKDFYSYVEEKAKSMNFDDSEMEELMETLEEICPRIDFTKLIKRQITL